MYLGEDYDLDPLEEENISTLMMMMMMIVIIIVMMMCRACGNIGTTFEALKQHSTATTYHEQVKTSFIPRKPFFLEMKIIFFYF